VRTHSSSGDGRATEPTDRTTTQQRRRELPWTICTGCFYILHVHYTVSSASCDRVTEARKVAYTASSSLAMPSMSIRGVQLGT